MQMEMPVRIDVVKRQPGRLIGFELRLDLSRHLPPMGSVQGKFGGIAGKVVSEASAMVDQARYVFAVRHRIAIDEDHMQPNAQFGQPPRALDRVGRRRRSHHETRGTENPAAMRRLNRGIDFRAEPEVVRGDNQMVQ
jgi:hypothetical protein